ncbi:hypothetical protein EDC04DRAFT_1365422 [Pisolithus marmoratus]|nr:hypothetical protein EDC04DRAFT_1365422 [Pisolithus marmoratus]
MNRLKSLPRKEAESQKSKEEFKQSSKEVSPQPDGILVDDTAVYAEGKRKEIIIALMGPTGAGKSSFIANAMKREDEGVGHDLNSCTSEIKVTKCEVEGSNVVLVDTPGFDDTKKTDLDILKLISDWLNSE